MLDYISTSSKNFKKNQREKNLYNDILVFLKNQLPYEFDLDYVFETIEGLLSKKYFSNIDVVYIGSFQEIEELGFNAMYKDNALYITNKQDNENDMIDDIVHEIAHAVEERFADSLYLDITIQNEFLAKRKTLYNILSEEGYYFPLDKYKKLEYDKGLDDFLYNEVGYPKLTSLSMGLFYSPYAITSLREYWANGFENYFLRDAIYLKKLSPKLYKKINLFK